MWSALIFAMATSLSRAPACELAALESIRRSVTAAYMAEDFDRALELAECEIRALQHAPPWLTNKEYGTPEHPCGPLEVIFNICNEHPEFGCAEATLSRYQAEGCSELPAYAVEYHRMRAQYHHRRLEYAQEFTALAAAAERAAGDAVCEPDGDGDDGSAWLEMAFLESQRGQLAAELRGWQVLRASVMTAERWLERADRVNRSAAAAVRNLVAWSLLLAREAGGDAGDPMPPLDAALATFKALRHRAAVANVRINIALAALQRGELARVEPALAGLVEATLGPEQRLWLHLVRVRAGLAAGGSRRVAPSLRALARLARGGALPTARYHAAWARGLAHEAAGRLALAVRAYQEAEDELERLAHGPLASQDGVTTDRAILGLGDAGHRLVRAQVLLGDTAAAVRSARLARTRALRVAARERCAASERVRDAPVAPGRLRLLYFPADAVAPTGRPEPRDVWVGLAITASGVQTALLTLPATAPGPRDSLAPWSAQLLDPFRELIGHASEIEILATGILHDVPFHELPWGGDILLAAVPVVHGLDIETCGDDRPRRRAAQIFRGPEHHDFDRETRQVRAALAADGYAGEPITPRTAADLAALLDDPPRMVHIAAHGEQPIRERLFLADDHIRFADGVELTRADILGAAAAPELVVFTSCRASAIDAETLGGGLSLAQAFMLRGARFVVGATADLDGEVATAFAPAFYRSLAGRPLHETPAAWRAAYLETRAGLQQNRVHLMRMLRLFAR